MRVPGRPVLALGLLAAAVSSSCGGGQSLLPRMSTVTLFEQQTQFVGLPRFGVYLTDFTVPASGILRIAVDWTLPTDDVDLVLSNPSCDAIALSAGLCKVLGSETSNVKPARITMGTSATAYRLFVINRGPASESGTVSVTVTTQTTTGP